MARNMVQSRSFRGVTGDKWLLKLEKKAFGWHYWSLQSEHEYGYEISMSGRSGHTTHRIIEWLEFRRPAPYTHNFLFILTELLDKIFSFFRRILISIGFPILVITLIAGIVLLAGCHEANMSSIMFTLAKVIAIGYACCIGGTLIFSGLGLLWRKVFKIDEKLKEIYGDDLETACTFAGE